MPGLCVDEEPRHGAASSHAVYDDPWWKSVGSRTVAPRAASSAIRMQRVNLSCGVLGTVDSFDWRELRLSPLGVHDELERMDLLVQRPQLLECLLPQLHKHAGVWETTESQVAHS